MTGVVCAIVGNSVISAVAEVRPAMYVIAENNAQISTAQSKFGGASALFDGTNDIVRANALDTDLLSGNFTFECWFRANNVSGFKIILGLGTEQPGRILLYLDGSTLKFDSYAGETPDITCSGTISANTWYHVAAVRSGSTITIYRDGTSVGTGTRSGTVGNRFGIIVGADGYYGNSMNGYIDEVRVSKIARYTSNFTPSSTAFVNDNDTILLLHCDGANNSTTFTDDRNNRESEVITTFGNAQVDTAQSKFGGASALFDGNGDYLSVSSSDGTFNFGTNKDFTIECWIRASVVDEYHTVIASNNSSYASSAVTFTGGANAQKLRFNVQGVGNMLVDSTALSANTWYHIAVTRSGSSWNLWRDGVSVSSNTNSNCPVNFEGNGGFNIGWTRWDGAVAYWDGHIDEFRISNTARYTSNFTPSTSAFVNDSNTLLLIHADGADASTMFTDDVSAWVPKTVVAIGNAQVSTSEYKFGTGSAYNGAVLGSDLPVFLASGSNFTFECWVRFTSGNTANKGIIGVGQEYFSRFVIYTDAGGQLRTDTYSTGYGNIASGTTVSTNTWYHVAYVRNSGTATLYLDGVSKGTSGNAGATNFGNTGYWFFGDTGIYVDEVRISNIARYTSNFTPASSAFGSGDGNTLRLYHCDGANGSTSFPDAS